MSWRDGDIEEPPPRSAVFFVIGVYFAVSLVACARNGGAPKVASRPACDALEAYELAVGPDPPDQESNRRAYPSPPSDVAVEAARLYVRREWKAAAAAFERVWSGHTGEELGNREVAEYYGGIALHKAGRAADAEILFARILAKPSHARYISLQSWREMCR
jgi:hypothetical protein